MSKIFVEQCKQINIFLLKRKGFFRGITYGEMHWGDNAIGLSVNIAERFIRFKYQHIDYYTENSTSLDYKFLLTSTVCNYGRNRFWFICGLNKNGRYCGKRVGVLYMPPGGKWFGCRHCWNLSYSERQNNYKGIFGSTYKVFDLGTKTDKLEETVKRKYWRNRPTRKYRRLLRYYDKLDYYFGVIDHKP